MRASPSSEYPQCACSRRARIWCASRESGVPASDVMSRRDERDALEDAVVRPMRVGQMRERLDALRVAPKGATEGPAPALGTSARSAIREPRRPCGTGRTTTRIQPRARSNAGRRPAFRACRLESIVVGRRSGQLQHESRGWRGAPLPAPLLSGAAPSGSQGAGDGAKPATARPVRAALQAALMA